MPQAALRELLGIARMEGGAAIAAGIAAAELWKLRCGRAQWVAVDLRAAAASLKSSAYLRIDGKPPAALWDPFSLFYAVKDGRWVRFHCNYPHHRAAALRVLEVGEAVEAAKRAAASWDGLALEDAIHAAGGCAALVRGAEEWAAHPHAAAVAGQPLLEIERIGDAPAQALPKAERPLSGIRVLDLTRVLAGPTSAKTLAEHGADVLKITAAHLPDSGDIDLDTGLGKLSAPLDVRETQGVETLRKLVRGSSMCMCLCRPGGRAGRGRSGAASTASCSA